MQPIVSIVVPTLTGRADGALESVRDQTFDSVDDLKAQRPDLNEKLERLQKRMGTGLKR